MQAPGEILESDFCWYGFAGKNRFRSRDLDVAALAGIVSIGSESVPTLCARVGPVSPNFARSRREGVSE
ncbi:transcriptional regulator [Anopheles sinensis]|uniref:Transcriptional regulator n=1 Tax=Anopheles sinensis TaxID=74873 RepID=A0A084WRE7_ANOSI|nr:transcriptional regulator [Anopheles sinensis]